MKTRLKAPPFLLNTCWHELLYSNRRSVWHWENDWIKTMSQLHDVDQHTHDRWHPRLPRQLNPNPPLSLIPTAVVVGVDNSTQGTMCCVPLKLVPWVKRTPGPSDGDTLIRDSQVFYHSVRLKQISFWGGMRCIHGSAAVSNDMCMCPFSFQVSNERCSAKQDFLFCFPHVNIIHFRLTVYFKGEFHQLYT